MVLMRYPHPFMIVFIFQPAVSCLESGMAHPLLPKSIESLGCLPLPPGGHPEACNLYGHPGGQADGTHGSMPRPVLVVREGQNPTFVLPGLSVEHQNTTLNHFTLVQGAANQGKIGFIGYKFQVMTFLDVCPSVFNLQLQWAHLQMRKMDLNPFLNTSSIPLELCPLRMPTNDGNMPYNEQGDLAKPGDRGQARTHPDFPRLALDPVPWGGASPLSKFSPSRVTSAGFSIKSADSWRGSEIVRRSPKGLSRGSRTAAGKRETKRFQCLCCLPEPSP